MVFVFYSGYQVSESLTSPYSSPHQEMATQSPGVLGPLWEAAGWLTPPRPWGKDPQGPWGAWLAPAPSPRAETLHMHQPSLKRKLEPLSHILLL